jgi:transcriptional regulator with GAF, ATPase, and Fis domain
MSKGEQLNFHYQALHSCIKQKETTFFPHFNAIIELVAQYLDFDPILPPSVATLLTQSYYEVFHAMRHYAGGRFFQDVYGHYLHHLAHLQNDETCARIAADLSFIFWMLKDLNQALKQGKRSAQLLEKCGNTTVLPGRYSNIGYIYECSGDLEHAMQFYQLGMQYGLRIQSDQVITLANCGFGRIALTRGQFKQAIHYFLEAQKRITDKQSDDYLSVCNNLGTAYGSMNMHQQALECFEPFITDQLAQDNPDAYISFAMNAANSYQALHQLDAAHTSLQQALRCASPLQNPGDLAGIMNNLGNLMREKKEYSTALQWFTQAHKLAAEAYDMRQELITLQGIAASQIALQNYPAALQALDVADPIANEANLLLEQARNHELRSKALEAQGLVTEAFAHYKQFKDLEMQIKNEAYNREIEAIKQAHKQPLPSPQRLSAYSGASLISQELQKRVSMPLIGCSSAMQDVVRQALLVAENDAVPVLITGESGCGKEAIARIIHYAGLRHEAPFVPVNSAAFAATLVESAFFGSEKGAYTGASSQKLGYFETANGGTLFLDEIGDMPLKMQSKFLRVIEEQVLHRIGSTRDVAVDFRLISATNKDLANMALSNAFRFDLLNRIHVMEIHLPPLRERQEDIPLLVDYYLQALSSSQGRATPIITKEAMDILASYPYPGNIRELKNIMQRSLLLCRDTVLDAESISLPQQPCTTCQDHPDLPTLNLSECEEWVINRAMELSGNVQKKAAQLLGITPFTLSRKLKRLREKNEK